MSKDTFTIIKNKNGEWYKSPDTLYQITGIRQITKAGIFSDGKKSNMMYKLIKSQESRIDFEPIFAFLRKEEIHYQVQCNLQSDLYNEYYLIISFDNIDSEYFNKVFHELQSLLIKFHLSIELVPVKAQERFKIIHEMAIGKKVDSEQNYLISSSWIEEIKMKDVNFQKDKSLFVLNHEYYRVYMIVKASATMFETICSLDGVSFILTEFNSVKDYIVLNHMKTLYLDVDQVISRHRKKYPALYDICVNGKQEDTLNYTMAGTLLLMKADIKEDLDDNEYVLLEKAQKENFEVISLYGCQKENFIKLFPIGTNFLQLRMNSTDEAIDFFPFI